jgi:AraC-like DNA-binding protein
MQQHEIDNRGTPMFPCGGYTVSVGDDITECIPWHWHEEVEVMVVVCGVLKLDVPNHTIILREGEAAFINSSVLHTAVNDATCVCEIKSFVFEPQLIFGSLESAIEQKYVRPLVNCPGLGIIYLQNNFQWHKEAIKCIEEAFVHYQEETFGYELLVREYLSKLWFLIISNHQKELKQHNNSKNMEAIRAKEMLGYIHAHYAEPISLKDVADSATISKRECLRCFNKILGTTPMKYLLNYRISVAAGMLINSALNITEICKLSGFDSPSYFSLKFKALTDMTPREYRFDCLPPLRRLICFHRCNQ